MHFLSIPEARRFYDRFGAKQDKQAWYEDPALRQLVSHADFASAHSVFEFGCGTGRLAAELLACHLPCGATYHGIDLSPTMVRLATERLATVSDRAAVTLSAGYAALPLAASSYDRFLSTYVLDLLPPALIKDVVAEASRILRPGGLLCLAGITPAIPPFPAS